MVTFLCGLSRPAVSDAVDEAVLRSRGAERKVFLFVPEQFSFETEKRLADKFSIPVRDGLTITSFSRFSEKLIAQYERDAGSYLDENGRLILMFLTLRELSDTLSLYGNSADDAKFAASLLRVRDEMKNAGLTPEQLRDSDAAKKSELLHLKLSDMAEILSAFEKRLSGGLFDHIDDITRAERLVRDHAVFDGCDVFFDAFSDFTAVQLSLCAAMMDRAENVGFGFLYDIDEYEDEAFAPVCDSLRRLRRMARERDAKAAEPVRVPLPPLNSECAFFKENFLHTEHDVSDTVPDAIRLVRARDRYDEARYTAAEIRRLCVGGGYRYRDIGVVVRDLSLYEGPLRAAFRDYGVPAFFDGAVVTGDETIAAFLVAAAELAAVGLRTEKLLQLAKTGFLAMDGLLADALENYAFVWNIEGARWLDEFTMSPRGLSGKLSPEDEVRLKELEAARRMLVGPVMRLRTEMKQEEGAATVRALYELTAQYRLSEGLKKYCAALDPVADRERIRGLAKQYQQIMALLSQLELTLRGVRLSGRQFTGLLSGTLKGVEYSQIPRALDECEVASADLCRDAGRKALFVLGLSEGVFPAVRQEKGLLSALDRRLLGGGGFTLLDDSDRTFPEELSFAYRSMTAFTERLYVSFPMADTAGNRLFESILVGKMKELYPALPVMSTEGNPALTPRAAALLAGETADGKCRATLLSALRKTPDGAGLVPLFDPRDPAAFTLTDSAAKRLYGEGLHLSSSKLDTFYNCRFQYFLKYGIGLTPLKKAELSPSEMGSVVHYVLEKLIGETGVDELSKMGKSALSALIDTLLADYVRDTLGLDSPPDARFGALLDRAAGLLLRLVKHLVEEFENSDFRPADCELSIAEGADVEPLRLTLPDGTGLLVEGKVDRADICERGGRRYVRVVDYKTGVKQFSLDDVYCGIGIQMLVYLFSICENGRGKYENAVPAGVLYMPARDPLVTGKTPEEQKKKRDRELRMNGLILEDEAVLAAMEKDAAGIFIPAKRTRDGLSGAASLASLEELGKLKNHVERLIQNVGQSLRAGDTAAAPLAFSDHSACDYCDYRAVCGTDEDCKKRRVEKLGDKTEFYTRITEGQHGGEELYN